MLLQKTDREINELLDWANKKKKCKYGYKSNAERRVVENIEALQASNWDGVRISEQDKEYSTDPRSPSSHQFFLRGDIVTDADSEILQGFNEMVISPSEVKKEIAKARNKPLVITLTSEGGNLGAGIEICKMLKRYPSRVTIKILGVVGSAASLIAISADQLLMKDNSSLFIHNARSGSEKEISKCNNIIAEMYAAKSGGDTNTFLKLMARDTFFTAEQAMNQKLIDGILFNNYLMTTQKN